MERRMLFGIKERAERQSAAAHGTDAATCAPVVRLLRRVGVS